jgi:hypothetical protein
LTGTFYDTIQTIHGCDSAMAIQLSVIPEEPLQDQGTITICDGQNTLVFGQFQSTPGIYYDTLQTINGCDSILSKQLNIYTSILIQMIDTTEICSGQTTLIFGQFQSLAGVYYDTLQSINGCDSILSKQLDVFPLPTVNFSPFSQDTLCIYSTPITISATPSGGNYSGNGVSSNQFNPATAGQGTHYIYYDYTDVNGCSATDSAKVFVDNCLGVDDLNPSTISIYPNPFSDFTTIYFGQELNGNYSVRIYDLLGKEAYINEQVSGNQLKIYRNELKVGVYIFSMIDVETQIEIYSTKLVVE